MQIGQHIVGTLEISDFGILAWNPQSFMHPS